uniref:BHLH domain-containing protein n=1 Tax=Anopheles epiroticus TaxID=199890 RepID=A0A182PLF0_9DIPT
MDEEGYWGSPCSSSESHPDLNRDRYSPLPPTVVNGSAAVLGAIRNLSSSSSQHQQHLPDQSSLSTSSLSSASSTSSSVSASSSPYGGAGHTHPTGGYHHNHHQHHSHSHHHQSHEQQHHHQQIPSSMYCSSVIYEKSNAGMYVPDEGYYGGTTGASVDPVTGTTGNEHQSSHLHMAPSSSGVIPGNGVPVVRVVKRRNTANKKERRRTQSINSAYTSLRDRIPNVPNDTKLSKIKTLRLAISYIAHLLAVVNGNQDPSCDFRAELVPSSRKINAERRAQKSLMQVSSEAILKGHKKTNRLKSPNLRTTTTVVGASAVVTEINFTANGTSGAANTSSPPVSEGRKIKGRTGWPQHVWALETKTTIK